MKALKKMEWVHDAHASQREREREHFEPNMGCCLFFCPLQKFWGLSNSMVFCMCFHPQTVGVWGDDPILTIYILVGVETQ